jgi:hypothetical protein
MPLFPCSACRRFVRDQDAACPFCGAARHPLATSSAPNGLVTLAAAAGLALVACQNDPPVPPDPQPETTAVVVATASEPAATVVAPPAQPAQPPPTVIAVTPTTPTPTATVATATAAPTVKPPKPFDRPMVARYGVAPRPRN